MKPFSTLLLLLLLAANAICQPFEGTVTFGVKIDNLPAGANPEAMAKFLPTGVVFSFGNAGAVRFKMDGPAGMDVLQPKGSPVAYVVSESKKKLYVMDDESMKKLNSKAGSEKPEVTKTAETETILGYPCVRYNVRLKTKQGESTQIMWVTDKLKPTRPKFDTQNLFNDKIDGMPLKMIMESKGGISMTMMATEVSTKHVDAAYLTKPAGYTEEPFSLQAMLSK
jgi:hypothetical protein